MAAADDEDEPEEEGPELPPGTRNYITHGGAARFRKELRQLVTVERPKVVEVVAWAAGNGDRSENGDYIYGKRRLREIDRRIRFITKRLEVAELVNPTQLSGDIVRFGATVTLADEEGNERTYHIVGVDETDAKRGRISWISPVGRAVLRRREGDVVSVTTPRGEEELEIIAVRYQAID